MKKEIAFYYPNPFWSDGDWIKNLILFFDGVGLLVPDYMRHRIRRIDPAIYEGLDQHGLIHIIESEDAVDKVATEKLVSALTDVVASGALDEIPKSISTVEREFEYISMSRMGYRGDAGLARMIHEELISRDLAKESEDGKTVLMHPMIRSLILTLLAQILRPYGEDKELELNPATDRPVLVEALSDLFSVDRSPSKGSVFSFDLLTVGVDLGPIPIDEVLDFRQQNYESYRAYSRDIRRFVWELSEMNEEERRAAFEERQQELEDRAADLRRLSRKSWMKPASYALSIAGVAWSAVTGDPYGIALGSGSSLLGLGSKSLDASAYSYIFSANRRFPPGY
ncbi:MAG: hypothetical protein AAFP18_02490 [Bacteroidota bacterium]